MNIAISLNSKYLLYTYVMLTSLFENNKDSDITVYVLNTDLTDDDKNSLLFLGHSYSQAITFINISTSIFPANISTTEFWTIETYFRLAMLDLLPQSVDKLLYLDVDMIINKSLKKLYSIPFANGIDLIVCKDMTCDGNYPEQMKSIFSSTFPQGYKYFNAGMVIWNISSLRQQGYSLDTYMKKAQSLDFKLSALDQDLLNLTHYNHVQYVDEYKYDLFSRKAHSEGFNYKYVKDNVAIVHFAGYKPWSGEFVHYDTEKIWWDYAKLIPSELYNKLTEEFIMSSLDSKVVSDMLQKTVTERDELMKELQKASELIKKLSTMLM